MTSNHLKLSFVRQLFFLGMILITMACNTEKEDMVETPTIVNGNQNISVNGVSRGFILFVPDSYDGDTAVPLMLNFHGFTQTARSMMEDIGDMRSLAESENFILVYPQGRLLGNAPHWNVGSWTQGSTSDDLGFIDQLIDHLAESYNIDQERVYACGFSNGGFFSFELACHLSNRIAAIGAVAANMSTRTYNSCDPTHPMPVITISGTADNIVLYNGLAPPATIPHNDVLNYWVNFNRTDTEPNLTMIPDISPNDGSTVELYLYENGENDVSTAHFKVINGRHDWPGSFGNMDIDANTEIWNFVSQFDINGKM